MVGSQVAKAIRTLQSEIRKVNDNLAKGGFLVRLAFLALPELLNCCYGPFESAVLLKMGILLTMKGFGAIL